MDFMLACDKGRATVDDTLSCVLHEPAAAFLDAFPEACELVCPATRGILIETIETGIAIPINEIQQRELMAFFMSVNTRLMREEMEGMRTCGAANFIPGRMQGDDDEP